MGIYTSDNSLFFCPTDPSTMKQKIKTDINKNFILKPNNIKVMWIFTKKTIARLNLYLAMPWSVTNEVRTYKILLFMA